MQIHLIAQFHFCIAVILLLLTIIIMNWCTVGLAEQLHIVINILTKAYTIKRKKGNSLSPDMSLYMFFILFVLCDFILKKKIFTGLIHWTHITYWQLMAGWQFLLSDWHFWWITATHVSDCIVHFWVQF